MTTGTRIAQKRKELGLSQEQLGERLGVSRQSIYKWESDAVLPEVEKLVALAKLFSVTVGWLLGIEEDGRDAGDGALNEAQLHMAEEIAARYRPQVSRKTRLWLYAAAAVMAAVFIFLFVRLGHLQSSYQALQNQLNAIQHELGNNSTVVVTQEQPKDSIASICKASVQTADLAANTVTFALDVVPKTYSDGMKVLFIADSDGETAESTAAEGENRHFTGTVTCPLTDDITLSLAFISGETHQTEVINTYSHLWSSSFRYIFDFTFGIEDSGQLPAAVYENHKRLSYDDTPEEGLPTSDYTKVRMGLFRDHKLFKWLTTLDSPPENWYTRNPDIAHAADEYVFFRNDETVSFEQGHSYTLVIVAADAYGREQVFPGNTYTYSAEYQRWDPEDTVSTGPGNPADWRY